MSDVETILAIGIVIFVAIGIHEYAHAKLADMAGDPTPAYYGRVTLNLTKHFEPIGTLMIIFTTIAGFGIGWGKPVPMDPRKMKNPKWDHFVAVAGGPLSNLLQAMVWAILLRVMALTGLVAAPGMEFISTLCLFGVIVNVGLFLFNLIPLGPLDGMWLFGTFLPEPARLQWTRFNLQVGSFLLLALVLGSQFMGSAGPLTLLFGPLRTAVVRLLIGT